MDNVLHRHNWKRAAALTALFAILLIVVAPLISISLQKDPMSGMHHTMMGGAEDMSSHQMPSMHTDASMPEHAHSILRSLCLARGALSPERRALAALRGNAANAAYRQPRLAFEHEAHGDTGQCRPGRDGG